MAETPPMGYKIRQYRKSRHLTLQEVAQKCGISIPFLSQIERNQARPSISTLHAIADALLVPVSDLFQNSTGSPLPEHDPTPPGITRVVRAADRRAIIYPGVGVRNEFLSPNSNSRIQMMWIVMPPQSSSGDIPFSHEGEECGIILQGNLETWIGDERFVLGPGDSIYHDSRLPHISKNLGTQEVIMVVAKTIPGELSKDQYHVHID